MKDYKRLTNSDLVLTLNYNNGFEDDKRRLDYASRLWELENKIESGELVDRNEYLDYLMAAKDTSELTDKEIEFFAKHNAKVLENANAEIARLTVENTELRARLENAVELPCVKMVKPKVRINRIGIVNVIREWAVVYIDRRGDFVVEHCGSKTAAEARLAERKGGKQ